MFLFRKEPEKPNYFKIVAITVAIIAAVAAAGYAAYLFCKKKGISCCFRKCDKCDENEEFDNEDFDLDSDADADLDVVVDGDSAAEAAL